MRASTRYLSSIRSTKLTTKVSKTARSSFDVQEDLDGAVTMIIFERIFVHILPFLTVVFLRAFSTVTPRLLIS